MSTTPPAMPDAMSEALGRLWAKFLPEIEARLALVESAANALKAGSLPDDTRETAHQAAHKLAGVLGTFGLHRGTELARQAELLLENMPGDAGANLSGWIEELRSIIQSRT